MTTTDSIPQEAVEAALAAFRVLTKGEIAPARDVMRMVLASALPNLTASTDPQAGAPGGDVEPHPNLAHSNLLNSDTVIVSREPTQEMLNAAVDIDSFKLGDISPLGFRCSPQEMFRRAYRAMIDATSPQPVEPAPGTGEDAEREARLVEALRTAYAKVAEWPENRMRPHAVEEFGEGFIDLLALRNLVPQAIEALSRTRQPTEPKPVQGMVEALTRIANGLDDYRIQDRWDAAQDIARAALTEVKP